MRTRTLKLNSQGQNLRTMTSNGLIEMQKENKMVGYFPIIFVIYGTYTQNTQYSISFANYTPMSNIELLDEINSIDESVAL